MAFVALCASIVTFLKRADRFKSAYSLASMSASSLPISGYLYYLQRLGLTTGFMQILNPYCIRRGSGEAVEGEHIRDRKPHGVLTSPSGRYASAASAGHVPHRCGDLRSLHQPACAVRHCGSVSRSTFELGLVESSRPHEPFRRSSCTDECKHREAYEIKMDPILAKLIELRDTLSSEVRQESGTIKDVEFAGTKLYQMYRTVESKVRSTRAYLRKLAKPPRENYFSTQSVPPK